MPVKKQLQIVGMLLGGFAAPIALFVFLGQHVDQLLFESRLWWSAAVLGLLLAVLLGRAVGRVSQSRKLPTLTGMFGWIFFGLGGPCLVAFANVVPAGSATPKCEQARVIGGEKRYRSGTRSSENASPRITVEVDGTPRSFFVDSYIWYGLSVGSTVEVCITRGALGLDYASSIKRDLIPVR